MQLAAQTVISPFVTEVDLLTQAMPAIYYGKLDFNTLTDHQKVAIVEAFVQPENYYSLANVYVTGNTSICSPVIKLELMRKIGRRCGFLMPSLPDLYRGKTDPDRHTFFVDEIATPVFALHSKEMFSSMADRILASGLMKRGRSPEYSLLEGAVYGLGYYLQSRTRDLLKTSPEFRAASLRFIGRRTLAVNPINSYSLDLALHGVGNGPFDLAVVRTNHFCMDVRVYLGDSSSLGRVHSMMYDKHTEELLSVGSLRYNVAMGVFHVMRD